MHFVFIGLKNEVDDKTQIKQLNSFVTLVINIILTKNLLHCDEDIFKFLTDNYFCVYIIINYNLYAL